MDRILGQPQAIELLQAALRHDHLHHAYIFHGPPGVGKFTTARAFAAALLCESAGVGTGQPAKACGKCRACEMLARGSHPDEHLVTKELARFNDDPNVRGRKLMSIPIEVLRTHLLAPVSLAPRAGARKVFIVDEAELIRVDVQNVLLKTLEEPPAGTIIILVTASEHRLLSTIRSRCMRVAFVPLAHDLVMQWLTERKVQLEPPQQRWLADFACGSFGRAQLALDHDLAAWAEEILPAVDAMGRGRYPVELGRKMHQIVEDFAKRWVADHDGASKEAANKHAAGLMWFMIAQHARVEMARVADGLKGTDAADAEEALEPYLALVDAVDQAERELGGNVNMGVAMDHAVSLMYRAMQGGVAA